MSQAIAPGSRIGVIAEGLPDLAVAADFITRLLRRDLRVEPRDRRDLAPKPILLRQAPAVAAALLEAGCAHVVILWDSAAFGNQKSPPEQQVAQLWSECDRLDADRRARGQRPVNRAAICPVPVIQELESWLIADERALSAYLGTPAHPRDLDRVKRPELLPNPKKALSRTFQQHGKPLGYTDYLDAPRIAAQVTDLARLRRLPSFQSLMANVHVQ